jgi:murein DD-endopeptidase MepM/ murein hydrolase activator NlpD
LYKDRSGKIRRIDEKTRIPVMHDGVVKATFKDYLGQAVIIEHKISGSKNGRFISVYAHTKPRSAVEPGVMVKEGDIVATLADTGNSKANILPHLHLSLGLPAKSFSYDGLVWNIFRNPAMITLLDPLAIIDWPYQAQVAGDPACRKI